MTNEKTRNDNPLSKITVYVHRTDRMRKNNKVKFQKKERPRIEVKLSNKEQVDFMYADEFQQYIVDNFEYGQKV